MRRNDRTSSTIKIFGQWLVTDYGLEAVGHYYPIAKNRLSELHWIEHMGDKNWVVMADFRAAHEYAKEYFKIQEGK